MRVAQHREPVGRADGEGVEAVEILQAALERLVERRSLAHPPHQIARRDLAVVLGAERDALALQILAHAVVVGQRAVVHEAQVEPGRERMRSVGRDPALGRHPRVAERMAAGQLRQAEPLDELDRQPDLLVDLDHGARAHHPHLGVGILDPLLGGVGRHLKPEDGVIGAVLDVDVGAQRVGGLAGQGVPRVPLVGMLQRQLRSTRRRRVAVEGNARRVRAAVVELHQHPLQVRTQLISDPIRFREQPRDSAHAVVPS